MPLFEYRCNRCSHRFTQLVGMTSDSLAPACTGCGSGEVSKLISRFSRVRSDEEALGSLEDAALSADMDDLGSFGKWVREIGKEMGEGTSEDLAHLVEETEHELRDGILDQGEEDL